MCLERTKSFNLNQLLKIRRKQIEKMAVFWYVLGLIKLTYATYLLTKGSGWAAFWFIANISDLSASTKDGFLDEKK